MLPVMFSLQGLFSLHKYYLDLHRKRIFLYEFYQRVQLWFNSKHHPHFKAFGGREAGSCGSGQAQPHGGEKSQWVHWRVLAVVSRAPRSLCRCLRNDRAWGCDSLCPHGRDVGRAVACSSHKMSLALLGDHRWQQNMLLIGLADCLYFFMHSSGAS